ncbi:MAG: hypothetical protein LBL80_05765 [Ruminococcus sp.]|jgi:uncharacterized FAD-dependent dehydrogenase|nr:hypothetical protein [Ruminococcus sp.]
MLTKRGAKPVFSEAVNFTPKVSANSKAVIVGFGPAGMFAGLRLAESGAKPIIIERGGAVEERLRSVNSFFDGGALDENSNVQFGEGGAGTFSDGKLTTRINDNRVRYVLETFVKYGAPEEILRQAKPHIGTDNLQKIVKNIRERIIDCGGEVRFNSKLTDINIKNGTVRSVRVSNNCSEYELPCDKLILAIGHSAHDTIEMLLKKGAEITSKPFSVGVRIEHKQSEIDAALYGENRHKYKNLPKGEYQLSKRLPDNRAVYTFCMCPGGIVVPSQSEKETIVTNGMSLYARDSENANSALCVSVSAEDFGLSPTGGINFARKIEHEAYKACRAGSGNSYAAPACTVKGLLSDKPSLELADITPSYARGVKECDFREIFPGSVTESLKIGLQDFSRKLKAFGNGNAVLTAPETRTSSPVRIVRNESFSAASITNLYPCGEGAGYAGGIVSAAVDGIKTAEHILL